MLLAVKMALDLRFDYWLPLCRWYKQFLYSSIGGGAIESVIDVLYFIVFCYIYVRIYILRDLKDHIWH